MSEIIGKVMVIEGTAETNDQIEQALTQLCRARELLLDMSEKYPRNKEIHDLLTAATGVVALARQVVIAHENGDEILHDKASRQLVKLCDEYGFLACEDYELRAYPAPEPFVTKKNRALADNIIKKE